MLPLLPLITSACAASVTTVGVASALKSVTLTVTLLTVRSLSSLR